MNKAWAGRNQDVLRRVLAAQAKSIEYFYDDHNRADVVRILVAVSGQKAEDVEKSYDFFRKNNFFDRTGKISRAARRARRGPRRAPPPAWRRGSSGSSRPPDRSTRDPARRRGRASGCAAARGHRTSGTARPGPSRAGCWRGRARYVAGVWRAPAPARPPAVSPAWQTSAAAPSDPQMPARRPARSRPPTASPARPVPGAAQDRAARAMRSQGSGR